jgi:site-specific DNA recombinase
VISRAVIDPKAAPIVQRIYDLFDHGTGYKQIAQILNGEGHRTLKGNTFRVNFTYRVLRNPAYVGVLEYNVRQDRGQRDPIRIPGFYPPIIDEALFQRVQEKVKRATTNFRNSRAYTTSYLLSGLVVCGRCGHHYVGTAAKSSKFHYYTCQTYLKKGKAACAGKLLNKKKLETAILDQIQKYILSRGNVEKYVELAMAQARAANGALSPEETANKLAIEDAQSRLRRWEETLERGLLSVEESAPRIKEIRSELAALTKNQARLEQERRLKSKIQPIPTQLMDGFINIMQAWLKEKRVGYKREFLRDLLKEVRVDGDKVTLTYRLPLDIEAPLGGGKRKKTFFTVLDLVEAGEITFLP